MAPLSMDRPHGLSEFLRWRGSAILSRGLTPSLLGRPICSLAPHTSLVKTVYRAPSNQVSTVYLSEPMDVTSCTAVKGSVSMVLSVIRFVNRDEPCFVLERCGIRAIAERPLSHRQMTSFRQREGAFLSQDT